MLNYSFIRKSQRSISKVSRRRVRPVTRITTPPPLAPLAKLSSAVPFPVTFPRSPRREHVERVSPTHFLCLRHPSIHSAFPFSFAEEAIVFRPLERRDIDRATTEFGGFHATATESEYFYPARSRARNLLALVNIC